MTNLRVTRVLGVAGVLALLAACDVPQSTDAPSVAQTATDETVSTGTVSATASFTVREFPRGESWDEAVEPLIVGVSNQSFDDPDVQLSASLDGVDLFDQLFAVEGQHTVTVFGVDVAPGSHTLAVVSDSGAEVEQTFDLPAGEQRWLVVNYWYFDPDARGEQSWGGEQEPGPSVEVFVSSEPFGID